MTNTFNDGKIAKRLADKLDGQPITPVVIFAPDGTGWLQPVTGGAGGGTGGGATTQGLVPLSRQTLTLTAAAQGLTVPTGAVAARISVRGGNASVAVTTPAPTATDGDLWPDGSMWELAQAELTPFRAVIASGVPVLNITYLGNA